MAESPEELLQIRIIFQFKTKDLRLQAVYSNHLEILVLIILGMSLVEMILLPEVFRKTYCLKLVVSSEMMTL